MNILWPKPDNLVLEMQMAQRSTSTIFMVHALKLQVQVLQQWGFQHSAEADFINKLLFEVIEPIHKAPVHA
jgi:hypothetical protein